MLRGTPSERFWAKIRKSEGCWEWTAGVDRDGYGVFRGAGDRRYRAHRYAWEEVHGPLASSTFLMHSCDNPRCVRVDHLSIGTAADNMRDCITKGRSRKAHGKALPQTRLTEDEVRAVRLAKAEGAAYAEIAWWFGMSEGHVWNIVTRSTFAWVN